MSGTFWSENQGLKIAHLSKDFAIVLADRSMDGTDRSNESQDSGPRGLKCDKTNSLETRNPAIFRTRLFECSLAREKRTKMQEARVFANLALPPSLAIQDQARVRDDLPQ